MGYDEKNFKMEPLLAKSWKRVSPTTLEFELRDDVKWHDGESFDADDVVYTLGWLTNPKTKIRFKRFWSWIGKVEKLGPHKVRISAKKPTPFDLARYAYFTAMVPEHMHSKFKGREKVKFGKNPVGTGPFKALQVDKNKGIIMERNDAYKHGGKVKPKSNIKRLHFLPIPDISAQVASFLVGKVDAIRNISADKAAGLAKSPNASMTIGQGVSYTYLALDARGRSGVKALTDHRVRKAIMMAIDRKALLRLRIGNRTLNRMTEAMCWRFQAGCDFTTELPKYDPAAAKKLMAEAGYAKGFDVGITTFVSVIGDTAVAVSGQLAEIGIRAKVTRMNIGRYRRAQRDGKIQIMVGGWPAGSMPDVSGTLTWIFAGPPNRDYTGDKAMRKRARSMLTDMDPVRRKASGKWVFNRATEMNYFIPLLPSPVTLVHHKDLEVKAGAFSAFGVEAWGFNWK